MAWLINWHKSNWKSKDKKIREHRLRTYRIWRLTCVKELVKVPPEQCTETLWSYYQKGFIVRTYCKCVKYLVFMSFWFFNHNLICEQMILMIYLQVLIIWIGSETWFKFYVKRDRNIFSVKSVDVFNSYFYQLHTVKDSCSMFWNFPWSLWLSSALCKMQQQDLKQRK